MGSVIIHNGIGYASGTQAAFYSPTQTRSATIPKDINTYSSAPWSNWYDDNEEPLLIQDDIENCPVLSGGIETGVRLAYGRGLIPFLLWNINADGEEDLEWCSDSEVNDFLEQNESYKNSYKNGYNELGYGWSMTHILPNLAGDKISRFFTGDVWMARQEKRNTQGIIENLYLCSNWSGITSYDESKMNKLPVLREGFELEHLQALKESQKTGTEYIILNRLLKNGRLYYPQPLHRSAKEWVKIARSIPSIKNAMNKNQMAVKYLITINEMYWEKVAGYSDADAQGKEKIKLQVYEKINESLTGENNAGKSIFNGTFTDEEMKQQQYIKIEVIDDKMKDGQMLPDSSAAEKRILFSMFSNPAIFGSNLLGDGASGGAGSGSDIREATAVLSMLLNPERQQNLRLYNLVKKFNGWDLKLETEKEIFPVSAAQGQGAAVRRKPRLVFRYPNSLLTTLDTGKTTKSIIN